MKDVDVNGCIETLQQDQVTPLQLNLKDKASLYPIAVKLDERVTREVHQFLSSNLYHWDEAILAQDKASLKLDNSPSNPNFEAFTQIVKDAESSLLFGPFTVVDKVSLPPSGDIHDYLSVAPYWWPNPDTPDHLPYFRRDGVRVPGSVLYDEGSNQTDTSSLWSFFTNTTSLGLAYYLTDDTRYGEVAARNIRVWFLEEETRMNPNVQFGQLIWGQNKNVGLGRAIIETRYMYQILDVVRILGRDGLLTEAELEGMKAWCVEFLEWLVESPGGHYEDRSANNHGTFFDVQAAAIAAFTDNVELLNKFTLLSQTRVMGQIKDDGTLPYELERETQLHYVMFGLQALHELARVCEKVGVNLWKVQRSTAKRPLLELAALNFLPQFKAEWAHEEENLENLDRFYPLYFNSITHYPELKALAVNKNYNKRMKELPTIFDQLSGVPLYWNIGMRVFDDEEM